MLKVEFKKIIISLLIWSVIFSILLGGVTLLYPTIMGDAASDVNKLLETMPQEFLSVFNMDLISIEKASGWLLTEGYMMLTLIGSMFFAYVGSSILLKEETDGTIFFLATKPVSRSKILLSKVLVGIIGILIFNFIISDVLCITLYINNDLDVKKWFFMLVGSTILHLFMFSLSFLISTFVRKVSSALSLSIGFIFISYAVLVIANISDKIDKLKYVSVFYYIDSKFIINDGCIGMGNIILLLVLSLICIVASNISYKKKELF